MVRQSEVENSKPLHALMEALEAKRRPIQEGVLLWVTNNPPRYPWRQSGKTPYEVLLGELCLKETSSDIAVPAYQQFVKRFVSIISVAEASEDDLTDILSRFGNGRYSQRIKMMVKSLLKQGKGDLPRDSESLARASGLEHYSIRAILCFSHGLPIAIIDENVRRMLSRIFSHTLPSQPAQGLLQAIGENLLPYGTFQSYNSGLLELAEVICQNKVPQCNICPLRDVCDNLQDLS